VPDDLAAPSDRPAASSPGPGPGGPGPSGPTELVRSSDDVTVALHDLGGHGAPLLLCHPTGLHGQVWAPMAAALAGVAHCWALDFRGHGDSTLPASGSLNWQGMADDVLAVVDHLHQRASGDGGPSGEGEVRGVGHSMGGAALVLAEQARPGTFAGLWCYEPIVIPRPEGAPRPWRPPFDNPLARAARRRRRTFPSREAALANYAAKPPLGSFEPEVLAAYVEHGFRDLPDGSVELKCHPETEAAVFEEGMTNQSFARLDEVACPMTVAASSDGMPPSAVAPMVARSLPRGRLHPFPHLTHFGPMEDPSGIAAAIEKDLFDR
jgi:pimeloyl-ACP methyl ester carboxylesterase